MVELSEKGYAKQVTIYLEKNDYEKAYELAHEFSQKFPNGKVAHFLLGRSAFWVKRYTEAAAEARKSFNMAKTSEDRLACAILASTALYELGEYSEGLELLKEVEKVISSEELEKALIIFSVALHDKNEARKHLEDLRKMNAWAAEKLMARFLKAPKP